MYHILVLLFSLIAGPLAAEKIGHVEYQLPNQGEGWKIAADLRGEEEIKSTTLLYIPENTDKEHATESFAAHANNLPGGKLDRSSLEKPIQMQFPDDHVEVKILESKPESVFYEWIVCADTNEKVHGWTRLFSYPQETVMLIYITEPSNENLRSQWMETLLSAKWISS